ncbi:MAG: hypothetical protein WAT19_05345 [Ferruginibacter sp.]
MTLEKNIIDNVMAKSSFVGLLALYFIKLRFERKEAFKKSDLEQIRSGEYVYGYFVACASFDLFEFTNNNDVFNITSFNIYLSENIKRNLIEKANQHDAKYPNDPKWVADILRIENI